MAFPTNPSNGDQYTNILGTVYQYQAADNKWYIIGTFDLVGDVSPQLGGALDTNGQSINDNSGDNIVNIDDNLNVAGNITVTGTVDGVDIAARDHAKQHAMDSATFHTSSDIATLDATTTKHGFLKKLNNTAANFMNGQGNWASPAGSGASIKTGTWTGNNGNLRDITGFGFDPVFIIVINHNEQVWFKSAAMPQWDSLFETITGAKSVVTNAIDLITDGIRLNNSHAEDRANINGWTYTYIAWG